MKLGRTFKAQAAIEFLAYVSVFIFAFLGVVYVFTSMATSERAQSAYNMALAVGSRVSQDISVLSNSPVGMYYTMSLPARIGDSDYDINVDVGKRIMFLNVNDEFNTTAVIKVPKVRIDPSSPCMKGGVLHIHSGGSVLFIVNENGLYVFEGGC